MITAVIALDVVLIVFIISRVVIVCINIIVFNGSAHVICITQAVIVWVVVIIIWIVIIICIIVNRITADGVIAGAGGVGVITTRAQVKCRRIREVMLLLLLLLLWEEP